VPHSGARCRSARQGGIAKNLPSRSSEPCTLHPVPCSQDPVVESVTTSKNHIPNKIKTVTPKKVTVSPQNNDFPHPTMRPAHDSRITPAGHRRRAQPSRIRPG
jgi:hypothetical protein